MANITLLTPGTKENSLRYLSGGVFGIKCDAYPGRLNQVSVFLNREGIFYGQCSEICGILDSSMAIVIESGVGKVFALKNQ